MDHTSNRPSPCTPSQRTHPRGSRPQSALQPRSPGDLSEECRSESNRYLLPGQAQHLRTTTHSDDVYLARSAPMRQKFSGSVTREINTYTCPSAKTPSRLPSTRCLIESACVLCTEVIVSSWCRWGHGKTSKTTNTAIPSKRTLALRTVAAVLARLGCSRFLGALPSP